MWQRLLDSPKAKLTSSPVSRKKKAAPKAAFLELAAALDSSGGSDRRTLPVGEKAEPREAERQHRPGRQLGDAGDAVVIHEPNVVDACDSTTRGGPKRVKKPSA